MANNITYGIIGVLAVLGSLGVIYITQEQADVSSYCNTTKVIAAFTSMSATNVTGYWNDINGTKKQSVCTKSKWIPLNDYMKANNLTVKDMAITPLTPSEKDEYNNPIISADVITFSDTNKVNIEGKVYTVDFKTKCILGTGCSVTDCIK